MATAIPHVPLAALDETSPSAAITFALFEDNAGAYRWTADRATRCPGGQRERP